MLVGACSGVVPFLDHANKLSELIQWCEGDDPTPVRILAGPGGVGKSRTAQELCHEMGRRHWVARVLPTTADDGAIQALARTSAALLVVLDNPEFGRNQLARLMDVQAERGGYRLRVVLTARSQALGSDQVTPVWGASDQSNRWLSVAEIVELADYPIDVQARRRLYAGAYQAFAEHLSIPASRVLIPPELDNDLYTAPLPIVVSAYLGLLGEDPPTALTQLYDRLLYHHEDRYWTSHPALRDLPWLQAEKRLRRRVVALASLAGAETEADAVALLAVIGDASDPRGAAPELARWASRLYPGPQYWNSLGSEVLAEHLVASTFRDEPAILAGVLRQRNPDALARPLKVLARATSGDPGLAAAASPVLHQYLAPLCDQAGRAPAGSDMVVALIDLVRVCPPDPAALPEILDALPASADPAFTALSLLLTQQATAHCRRLAEADLTAHRPNLAIALNNLSVRLADVGRNVDALAAIGEAAGHFRSLVEADPPSYLPSLATALHNLQRRLTDLGHGDEAVAACGEMVASYRRLVGINPDVYLPKLAGALRDLSLRLSDTRQLDRARAAITEAVALNRELARADPTVHIAELAGSLRILAHRLADLGLTKEAKRRRAEAEALVPSPRRRRPRRRRS